MARERKVKSFERFSGELDGLELESIAVQPFWRPARGLARVTQSSVGLAGDYDYGLRYVLDPNGEQKVFREPLFTSGQSEHGFHDADTRRMNAVRATLAGEIRVGQLSVLLAGVEIFLADPAYPHLEPMSLEVLDKLHVEARENGIEAAEFIT